MTDIDPKKKKDKKKKDRLGGGVGGGTKPKPKPKAEATTSVFAQLAPDMSKEEEHAAHLKSLQVITNSKAPGALHGLCMIEDFITVEEEKALLAFINKQPWDQDTPLPRRTQQWGYAFDYEEMTVLNEAAPIPPILDNVVARMRSIKEEVRDGSTTATERYPYPAKPQQLIINEYTPGQGIHPHIDRACFGDCVASLSLGGAVPFVFDKPGGKEGNTTVLTDASVPRGLAGSQPNQAVSGDAREVYMPPRCLVMMKGDARWKWTHAIPFSTFNHRPGGVTEKRHTRVSLTFRTVTEKTLERVGLEAVDHKAAWTKPSPS